jgi:hypothetical protein
LGAWAGSGFTASDQTVIPGGSLSLAQGARYLWNGSTAEGRALQSPDKSTRRAGTWYDANAVKLRVNVGSAGYTGNLRVYALDWDAIGRRETITIDDGSGARTTSLSSDFSQGAWVAAPINVPANGSVTITATKTAGVNAVISGVFLGDAGPPPPG